MAVVDEALGVDRFEVAGGNGFALAGFDADRFDPVKRILENKVGILLGQGEQELVRHKRVLGRSSDIEEKRSLISHDAMDLGRPILTPPDEVIAFQIIAVGAVVDPEIIGWGGHDEIYAAGLKPSHSFQTVFLVELMHGRVSLCGRGKGSLA